MCQNLGNGITNGAFHSSAKGKKFSLSEKNIGGPVQLSATGFMGSQTKSRPPQSLHQCLKSQNHQPSHNDFCGAPWKGTFSPFIALKATIELICICSTYIGTIVQISSFKILQDCPTVHVVPLSHR